MVLARMAAHHRVMNRQVVRPGPWYPVAVDDDPQVAAMMATIVLEEWEVHDARAVGDSALVRELGSVEVERIVDRLRNPTIKESRQAGELAAQARERLHRATRSGGDNR